MDEDREKGRIDGHTTKRKRCEERARAMLPILQRLGAELHDKEVPVISLQRIADWLNYHSELKHPDLPPKLHRTQVARLLDVKEARSEAESASQRQLALLDRQQRLDIDKGPVAALRYAELKEVIFDERDALLEHSWALTKLLKSAVGRWGADEEDDYTDWRSEADRQRHDRMSKVNHLRRRASEYRR